MRDSWVLKEKKSGCIPTKKINKITPPAKHTEATGKTSDSFWGSFDASLCRSAACGAKL